MNVHFKQDRIATFDGTTDASVTPAAGVAPRGVRIDVDELSRRVRVRNRGELTLLDARVVHALGRRARRDRRSERRRQDDAAGGDRRHRPGNLGVGALRRHRRVRQPGDIPQRARLRAAGRHHPRRPAARTHAPLRRAAAAPVVDKRGRGRRRRPRRDRRRRPDRSRRRPGRLAERRAAQARQHRRRAAHRSARLLPRRADVRPRPGHERGADRPPAPARRPVGDGRVHDALGRGPGSVRSHRVHDARWASGLRRDRRRGARAASGSARSPSSTDAWPIWTAPPTQPARTPPCRRPTPVPET